MYFRNNRKFSRDYLGRQVDDLVGWMRVFFGETTSGGKFLVEKIDAGVMQEHQGSKKTIDLMKT